MTAGLADALLRAAVLACAAHLLALSTAFVLLLLVALRENAERSRETSAEDFAALAASRFTIPVSVVQPVYDEEPIAVAAVQSLLGLEYPEFEVIVVNDGSRDGTLATLTRAFSLERRDPLFRRVLDSRPLRGIYRSRTHPRLTVVDKQNGGKADALNAGVNLARYRYVCCVDGDTVYAPDALLRGMRLAMRDPGRVICVTSHVAIGSRPELELGASGPRAADPDPLANFQQIEYLRAFLNNRLAWTRLGFMLCAVGAFAIWRRDTLLELGGFSTQFTCEDIELTFRAHERLLREGRPCRIVALPDTVGKTEGPDRIRTLIAQRARWQRVILETLWHYRHMLLNPRYGTVGLLGMPYYVLSEGLAPVFELLAWLSLFAALALGSFEWPVYLAFVGAMSFGNALLTSAALGLEDRAARDYRLRDLVRLVLLGPLEMIAYRPWLSWARLVGSWGFLRGDKAWHKFERNARPKPGAAAA